MLLSLALIPSLEAEPQFGGSRERFETRDRVCFYQDIHYNGWEQCYSAGDEVADLGGRKKAISSMRVFGRARVLVYEDPEFHGRSEEFSSDVRDLGLRNLSGSKSWSDQIESFRIVGLGDYNGRGFRNGPPAFDRNDAGICVYDRRNFEGREECWRAGSDLGDLARAGNWSDRISSIRVFGRTHAVLYRDIGFRGDRISIDRDIADLGQLRGSGFRNWDRQISSLAVETNRGRR
jgi:hypothetical protein